MLYFHGSGRLAGGEYLARDGWFRPMVLVAGIGLCVLGLFNLATMGAKEADCCDDGHDHDHGHDHHHDHEHGACCGHDHSHEHHHHHHEEAGVAAKGHAHAYDEHGHAHGILEESGSVGRLLAIIILVVPVSYAAMKSPDRFSAQTAVNKGVYTQNYADTSAARQYSRVKTDEKKPAPPAVPAPAPVVAAATPPATAAGDAAKAPDAPPATATGDIAKDVNAAPAPGAQTKSYGNFTLADLKAQVPQSKEGNFLLEVPEIYYTAGDKEVQGVLAGQSVETTAQVLPEKLNNPDGKRVRIFRLLIQCCAADARPFSIPVEFDKKAPEFKESTWVKVIGTMTYKSEGGQTVPVLQATSMVESAEPDNKMIY
jgi:uncharacterized repeat protein (TIGR03943 family)